MPTETQLENLLSLTRDIKSILEAQQCDGGSSAVVNRLNQLSDDHEAIRRDIQQILLQIVQFQTAGAD